jgi:type III secretion protein C
VIHHAPSAPTRPVNAVKSTSTHASLGGVRASRVRIAVLALAATLTVLVANPGLASEQRLPTTAFVYDAKQTPLTDVLRDFAGSIGLPIIIADGVTGIVNSKFTIAPRGFLDLISRSFGLIWYHDGSALHIYPSSQIQTRMYRLTARQAVDIESRLMAFGLLDGRYPVRVTSGGSVTLVFASGPPRHLELIDALLEATSRDDAEPPPLKVRVFQLTHASAVDRTVQGASSPGVATLLSNFFGGQQGAGPKGAGGADPSGVAAMTSGVMQANESMVASAASLVGTPEARARRNDAVRSAANSLKNGGAPSPAPSRSDAAPLVATLGTPEVRKQPGPSFTADEATNLVLVRAPDDQMADIEAMIARLDVAREMIEVEATIIDVSSDEVDSLGFEWSFSGNTAVRSLELSPAVSTTTSSGAIPQGGGFNITTLLASGGRELLARIRALEARGTARVVSQPKVLGAANRTAVLSDKRTASVRVAGNQDARLYSVETGTTLQVTPRVIQQADVTRIGLELLIEDGGFSTQSVDDVPIAQRTSISTIATLNEGQALLVGGIEVEGSSNGRSGIPGLSRLPWVGGLFRYDSTQASRRQRLFLITPKRVLLDAQVLGERASPAATAASAAHVAPGATVAPAASAAPVTPAQREQPAGLAAPLGEPSPFL